eukprot:gb/GECG01008342.1/.p1 GENE.gb/GECG01008342.1/~~gb/GECG01008342.1/.p1  ORF type:complete len:196 (+),score=50.44 gb/GECG01008342.1/:1-588(+)
MPPKKKGGKKKGGGGDGSDLDPQQAAKAWQLQSQALKMRLAQQNMQTSEAVRAKRELQSRVADVRQDVESHEQELFDVTADMTRQYKAMEENYMKKIQDLEEKIHSLKDELAEARVAYEDMCNEKDQVIRQKDEEIDAMKQRMEDMANEFADMLQDTLKRMSEKIEISATKWEGEASVPVLQRMEEIVDTSATNK